MLKDLLNDFKELYSKYGEQLVIANYSLAPASYVVLSLTDGIKDIYEVNSNTKNTDNLHLYMYFASRDYYSKLLDMNKPVDGKKVIHSNQIYSFFVKKENLYNGKLTQNIIDEYYSILLEPRKKYKDKKKREMYEQAEALYGPVNAEEVEQIKQCILKYLPEIKKRMNDDKNYLKIFIEKDEKAFEVEGKKYVIPNIFNSTDFNVSINGQIYGLPNNNMGLNAKKTFLENKHQKTTAPTLLSVEDALLQKSLFEYLMNFASKGIQYVYFDKSDAPEKPKAYKSNEMMDKPFMGYFLRIKKGMELEIHDFDIIQYYNPKVEFELLNVLFIELNPKFDQNISFQTYEELKDIQQMVNQLYFRKFLTTNYFTDAKDIKLKEANLKESLIISRNAWFEWFYKGNTQLIRSVLDIVSLKIIKETITFDSYFKARHQFNLYYSLKSYLKKGDVNMADILKDIKNRLREKIKLKETASIESDDEYYFAVGQVTYYFLSLSKSSSNSDALINPIINCSNIENLSRNLYALYRKYNYEIEWNLRFRNLFAMIQGYYPEKRKVNTNLIIAGYLHSNLIYEKQAKESDGNIDKGELNDGE